MAENCAKCKKSINSKDPIIICNSDDCLKKFHRSCVNIDDAVYDAIQKNPLVSFNCEECKNQSLKALVAKLHTMEEKVNKVCNGVNQIQGRMYQQYFQCGNANIADGKKQTNNLIVVGNNCNSDRLQVVCDYGRWVQVGKFATSTSEEDIIEHLAEELKINKNLVKCTKLVKNDANLSQLSYCKFKISIPDYRFNELFNEAIWPSGVMTSKMGKRTQTEEDLCQGDHTSESDQKKSKACKNFKQIFKDVFGYDIQNFRELESFSNWLHRPVDGSALGAFRFLYGAAMLIDIAEERGGGQMDVRFGEPKHCHFPLFDAIQAAKFPIMGCIYLCMWIGAIGITLGYRFKLSCLSFIVPYWYIFLLDKPAWNNHSYLFGLVGTILLFTHANRYCSLDKFLNPSIPETVPYWNYFLIKFQFFLLYMYAGLKKLTSEWLSGYAMSSLSHHWIFTPFRSVMSPEMTDLLIVHWFTAIFDFSIAFFMTCEKTRRYALPFMLSFHLMNSRLFIIGMFPWVCLAQVPMFFGFDWPRKFGFIIRSKCSKLLSQKLQDPIEETLTKEILEQSSENSVANIITTQNHNCHQSEDDVKSKSYIETSKTNRTSRLRSIIILAYCVLQLFLPYSHFITKGYNNWTNGLYGYSWDMMVHSYDTILTSIKIVDNSNNHVHYLDPYAFTQYDRWTKYADMAVQYAKCIEKNIRSDLITDADNSPLESDNFSIYFDIWCSMNGRFQQRVFDPRTDLLKAHWSPFERTLWSLPLLNELNHMRPRLKTIAHEVLAWNNYSDVIFVADFPGLTLDNYISTDLTNISLTILEGNVRYESDTENESFFLTSGKSIPLNSGVMHHITTIGSKPSCYMYTYVNKTMLESGDANPTDGSYSNEPKHFLPLWQEFKDRVFNYLKFLNHMGNCVLYLLHGVPIPMEIRHRE